jgi:hypothetical protein
MTTSLRSSSGRVSFRQPSTKILVAAVGNRADWDCFEPRQSEPRSGARSKAVDVRDRLRRPQLMHSYSVTEGAQL